jgi:hypothetical protein
LLRAAVNQISNGFGLCQVQFVVQKCALTELAGLRDSGTELDDTREQKIHQHRPAVRVQLEHIFACERCGTLKVQCDTAIQGAAIGVAKIPNANLAGDRHVTKQLRRYLASAGSGNSEDTDATAAGRRSDSGNGV